VCACGQKNTAKNGKNSVKTPDDTQLETTERRLGPMGSETIGQAFDPASFEHVPVLLNECLDGLAIDPAGIYLDGTAGGAGHSRQIALRLDAEQGGRLISLDQDPDAVQTARARLAGLPATVVQINFRYAGQALEQLGIDKINGALLDLGVSSHQLDDAARGFSYRADAPLDMRMSQEGETAADLVNTESREELARILKDYGEEPFAWQIAGKIVEARENSPIETTLQLADIVASAMPAAERRKNKNPSRRTFQALRIAVNHELDALEEGMDTIFEHLAPGGRLCIITFHSLEDRLVKNKFRRWATACTCPPEFPVCVCGGRAKAKLITRRPIEANTQELEENRRSRSAHLRVLEKI
jgi:16S rRNA (cytosine1402-N4)-methyltransferase